MSYRVERPPHHACRVPYDPDHGIVIRCQECGTRWQYKNPGNPYWAGWAQIPWWNRILHPARQVTDDD